MAQGTGSHVAIHHDASTARRVAGFRGERPRNRVADHVVADVLPGVRDTEEGREQRRGRDHRPQASVRSWFFSGSERMRFPVAANIALHTAGAIDACPGSPTPPQNPPEGASTTSTLGISGMRIMR